MFSSVVLDFLSCIKGVSDYYATVVFQMGQCLEDSGKLGIEYGLEVHYSDMSCSCFHQQIETVSGLTHFGVEGSISVNHGSFWEVVPSLGNGLIC